MAWVNNKDFIVKSALKYNLQRQLTSHSLGFAVKFAAVHVVDRDYGYRRGVAIDMNMGVA